MRGLEPDLGTAPLLPLAHPDDKCQSIRITTTAGLLGDASLAVLSTQWYKTSQMDYFKLFGGMNSVPFLFYYFIVTS